MPNGANSQRPAGPRAGSRKRPARWAATLHEAFAQERRRLWGLCYRMSGCAADADDWLQDCFERALRHPPADTSRALAPWLTRVTINLCRDHLRRRQHRAYTGPWLPGPVEQSCLMQRLEPQTSPDALYDQLESVSLAFLTALEVLSPNQRAVLVLRDVIDLSTRETADALELSEATVKTTLHRARHALKHHEGAALGATSAAHARACRDALYAFLFHFATGNTQALSQLLASDVVMVNDGAGKYFAAQREVVGRDKVLLFHRKTARLFTAIAECALNDRPGLLVSFPPSKRARLAPRAAVWVELDAAGRIKRINYTLADRKLEALPWHRMRFPSPALVARMLTAAARLPGEHPAGPGRLGATVGLLGGALRRLLT